MEVAKLQVEISNVFSHLPGHANLTEHHNEMSLTAVVHSHPYRLLQHKKQVVQDELQAMLDSDSDG